MVGGRGRVGGGGWGGGVMVGRGGGGGGWRVTERGGEGRQRDVGGEQTGKQAASSNFQFLSPPLRQDYTTHTQARTHMHTHTCTHTHALTNHDDT